MMAVENHNPQEPFMEPPRRYFQKTNHRAEPEATTRLKVLKRGRLGDPAFSNIPNRSLTRRLTGE